MPWCSARHLLAEGLGNSVSEAIVVGEKGRRSRNGTA